MFKREENIIVAKFTKGEIMENLENLMNELKIKSAFILNGIGQLENIVIGYFNGKDYVRRKIEEPAEMVSLQGNIGMNENKYIVHAHVALGLKNHSIIGGHLIRGEVKIVNEIFLYELKEIEIKRIRKGNLMEMVIS